MIRKYNEEKKIIRFQCIGWFLKVNNNNNNNNNNNEIVCTVAIKKKEKKRMLVWGRMKNDENNNNKEGTVCGVCECGGWYIYLYILYW